MKWFDINNKLPEPNIPVLVSDGYGEVAVANSDIFESYDSNVGIYINLIEQDIRFWTPIDLESCPLPDWKD